MVLMMLVLTSSMLVFGGIAEAQAYHAKQEIQVQELI